MTAEEIEKLVEEDMMGGRVVDEWIRRAVVGSSEKFFGPIRHARTADVVVALQEKMADGDEKFNALVLCYTVSAMADRVMSNGDPIERLMRAIGRDILLEQERKSEGEERDEDTSEGFN